MRLNRSSLSTLDRMRMQQNTQQFRSNFRRLGKMQRQRAISYLNEARLRFPTLYLLIPEIQDLDLFSHLNLRNLSALKLCAQFADNQALQSKLNSLSADDKNARPAALKWILQTGAEADGLSHEYDQILDASTAMLTPISKENSLLPQVADLVFTRHRKGAYLHDLVWGFFQSANPETLKLLAEHLLSRNPEEAEFAQKLLNLLPLENQGAAHPRQLYAQYKVWLQENLPYLYYTGESMQYSSRPQAFRVNLDAKYLHKKISPVTGNPVIPPNASEESLLQRFHEAEESDQKILAAYSLKLHKSDVDRWKAWLEKQTQQQLLEAKSNQEGAL
ncbi:MAG: hypothetical protein ACOYI4_02230 [Christensenellales bacterium]|jgi:hypothetical protein